MKTAHIPVETDVKEGMDKHRLWSSLSNDFNEWMRERIAEKERGLK